MYRAMIASAGAVVYAFAGGMMGSQNAGWFGLERDANAVLPALGVGTLVVVAAFLRSRPVLSGGALGRAAVILLVVGSVFYLFNPLLEFAILGTFGIGFGLVLLTLALARREEVPVLDRVLIGVSAVASLTWNTETNSAFLLVVVGVVWVVLSFRLLPSRAPLAA